MPRRTIVDTDTLRQAQKETELYQKAIEFEKKKTAAQKTILEKIKTKKRKLEFADRRRILRMIALEARRRYQYNLLQTGYKGNYFMDAFKYEIDEEHFKNYYYLDTGNQKLNQILQYLEYGTGLYGSLKHKYIESTRISDRTGKRLLMKFEYEGNFIFKRKVRGIKPGFMFTKAVESIRHDMKQLVEYYSKKKSSVR